jgi:hypothetical protein
VNEVDSISGLCYCRKLRQVCAACCPLKKVFKTLSVNFRRQRASKGLFDYPLLMKFLLFSINLVVHYAADAAMLLSLN